MATATKTATRGRRSTTSRRATTRQATTRQRSARKTAPAERKPVTPRRTATVNLPFVTAEFRAPNVRMPTPHLPSRQEVASAITTAKSNLPSPERLAFYAGLGVLAVAGAIEWPVAAAIGAGTVVAQRAVRWRPGTDWSTVDTDGSQGTRKATAGRRRSG